MKIDKKIRRAFTLVELMMSVGCSSLVLAALVAAGACLQKSFAAVEGYSTLESDQLRVLDYIALDCRRALSISWANNVLTLTLPTYYDSSGNPVTPTFDPTRGIQYGTGSTVTIAYSQSGSNFMRSITVGSTTTTTAIATNISTFTVTPQVLTSTVSCSITFAPRFVFNVLSPTSAPVTGTTVYCNTFVRNAIAR